jgi:hypothetical protein
MRPGQLFCKCIHVFVFSFHDVCANQRALISCFLCESRYIYIYMRTHTHIYVIVNFRACMCYCMKIQIQGHTCTWKITAWESALLGLGTVNSKRRWTSCRKNYDIRSKVVHARTHAYEHATCIHTYKHAKSRCMAWDKHLCRICLSPCTASRAARNLLATSGILRRPQLLTLALLQNYPRATGSLTVGISVAYICGFAS